MHVILIHILRITTITFWTSVNCRTINKHVIKTKQKHCSMIYFLILPLYSTACKIKTLFTIFTEMISQAKIQYQWKIICCLGIMHSTGGWYVLLRMALSVQVNNQSLRSRTSIKYNGAIRLLHIFVDVIRHLVLKLNVNTKHSKWQNG